MASAVSIALGLLPDGTREVLGLWIEQSWRDQATVRGTVVPDTGAKVLARARRVRGRALGPEAPRRRAKLAAGLEPCDPVSHAFPEAVRRIVTTTNAIEAPNSKLRRAVRARGQFPSDEAATALLSLVLNRAAADWKHPPREWVEARTQFAITFDERSRIS